MRRETQKISQDVLDQIIQRVVAVAEPDKIILFGSAARGEMGPHSDVDLLVVKSGEFDYGRLVGDIYMNLHGVGQAVDIVLATPEQVDRYRDTYCLVIAPALQQGKEIYRESTVPGRYPPEDHREWLNRAQSNLMLAQAQDQLVRRDLLVGDFYMTHGDYYAALRRYRRTLADYPDHTDRVATLARLADAMKALRRYYEAEQLYTQVLRLEPDEATLDRVLEQLEEIQVLGMNGAPPMPRSCVTDPNPACAVEREPVP